jgi:hypothetical protein
MGTSPWKSDLSLIMADAAREDTSAPLSAAIAVNDPLAIREIVLQE